MTKNPPSNEKDEFKSDTVIITPDGRLTLDVDKLFAKEHIKQTIEEMIKKIVIIKR